jgi:ATP-dependent DNA helicase RecG
VNSFLNTPIEFLKGVGPQRAELLQQEIGVFTFNDFLQYYPFRYVDRTQVHLVKELTPDMPYVQLKGKLSQLKVLGNAGKQRLVGKFSDGSGSIDLIWFKGVKWLQTALKSGETYVLFGKPSVFNRGLNIAHPELESPDSQLGLPRFQAVYPNTEKLRNRKIDNKVYQKWFTNIFTNPGFQVKEYLPEKILARQNLVSRELALKWVHNPANHTELSAALERLKFDEFFLLQLSILRLKKNRKAYPGLVFNKIGQFFNAFFSEQLSFELTGAQKRVIKEIRNDLGSGQQMNRLPSTTGIKGH